MKYNNKIRHFGLLCLLALPLFSCTDWDDHYDGGEDIISDKTLWEEIESRPELTKFKDFLEQYGYKDILSGSQMYTVFAPVGDIDTTGIGSSAEKVKTEVIENHIARFAHSANSATNDNSDVLMLNNKIVKFTYGDGGYMFGSKKFTEEHNIRAKNGVLHVIEGQQMFFPNIWEYLTTDTRFDSIRNYLYSFNDTLLDENNSVKGEINENGQQEYLDSVVNIYNSLFYYIGELNNEDSTYTMIVPTNKAWSDAYKNTKKYYVYPKNMKNRDSLQVVYSRRAIVRDLVFSHTMQKSVEDSLVSTTKGVFKKPFDYILSGYSDWNQSVKCSNGGIFIVDTLRHQAQDSWHTPIKFEAEQLKVLNEDDTKTSAFINRRTLPSTDSLYTKVSNASFLELTPKTATGTPIIYFNIWNTLSGNYDVKIVFLPQTRAIRKGNLKTNRFKAGYSPLTDNGHGDYRQWGTRYSFNEKSEETLDTVNVGSVKLTRSVYGTEMIGLKVKLESQSKYSGKEFSTTYLIDCIILEPSEK